jgi:hypothetical protein
MIGAKPINAYSISGISGPASAGGGAIIAALHPLILRLLSRRSEDRSEQASLGVDLDIAVSRLKLAR